MLFFSTRKHRKYNNVPILPICKYKLHLHYRYRNQNAIGKLPTILKTSIMQIILIEHTTERNNVEIILTVWLNLESTLTQKKHVLQKLDHFNQFDKTHLYLLLN